MFSRLALSKWPVAAGLALILAAIPGVLAAQTPRAGLVVVHGDGNTLTRCVELPATTISGVELLVSSGLDLSLDASGGMGTAICRVDNEGCSYPQDDCFCQCQGAPCVYWSYWRREGDAWIYSSLGASSTTVSDGSLEAWVWNTGTVGRSADREPPSLRFEDVCAPAAAEPSPADTPTPQPTVAAAPVIDYFRADYAEIVQGEPVTLRWDLHNANQAMLRYDGLEEGVTAPGGKPVTPAITTTYVLVARGPGGEVEAQVTVAVIPATPRPEGSRVLEAPTAIPEIPAAAPAVSAPQVAAPTATGTPLPTVTPLPTATPLSTATPGWSTWETTPLTGTLVVVMPTPRPEGSRVASSGAALPVIVNPTPRPILSPMEADQGTSAAGRVALSLSAVVLPAALLLALLVARRRR